LLSADLTGLPSGNDAQFVTNLNNTSGTLTWTPTESDGAGPFMITFTAGNALTASAQTTVLRGRRPLVTVTPSVTVNENQQLSLVVTASDPDGDAIDSLTADLAGVPAGDALFSVDADHTSATLSWTPTFADGRMQPYDVTFRAANALSGSSAAAITVSNVDRAPVVTVQADASRNENQNIHFTVTASDPDGDPIAALSANLSALPAGSSATFVSGGAASGTFDWTPVVGMGRVAPYLVTFTAANALSDSASTSITVNALPLAALAIASSSGVAPISFTANAGGSTDSDGPIVSYTFNFGDGTIVGPQASPAVAHTYGSAGTFTVTVVVTDDHGASATASRVVSVVANLCGNPGFDNTASGWGASGSSTVTRVSGGRSGGFCLNVQGPATTSSFGTTDSPNWVTATPAVGTKYRFTAWVRSDASHGSMKIKVREYLAGVLQGTAGLSLPTVLSPTWQQVVFEFTCIRVASTLDFEVNDTPVATGESFQVDDVTISIVTASPAAIMSQVATPADPTLGFSSVVMPNPIRIEGQLTFTTTRAGMVRVEFFDVNGRIVQTPLDAFMSPGRHGVPIRVRGVMPAGVYFYRLHAAEGVRSGRLVVID